MSSSSHTAPKAPPLGVTQWVNAAGEAMAHYDLDAMGGGYKLLFCFQHACPGCHVHGFPSLARLVEATRGADIRLAAIQTVFEDWDANSYDAMLDDQRRYALPIPFGHDPGVQNGGSVLMQRYGNRGTPWFILIAPDGSVLHSHFSIDVDKVAALLRRPPPAPPTARDGVPNWDDVIRWASHGNPPPPRRVEKSDAEWRAQLSAEQYYVTREKGTERAHSSSMCQLFQPGRYRCACCGTELFDAGSKYNSHSGWPSFTQPLAEGVVAYHLDGSHGMQRIETSCQVCDAHLGHVFPDGPEPSGLRYCINALALQKSD